MSYLTLREVSTILLVRPLPAVYHANIILHARLSIADLIRLDPRRKTEFLVFLFFIFLFFLFFLFSYAGAPCATGL